MTRSMSDVQPVRNSWIVPLAILVMLGAILLLR